MSAADDLLAQHGRSDRTALLAVAAALPAGVGARAAKLLQRGDVAVLHGLGRGLRFPARAVPPEHAHAQLVLNGLLELPVQEALRRTVPDGGVVWDVGANVGFLSLVAARLAGERGRVVAFEPAPEIAALLREAAVRSGLEDRVEVRGEAVSDAPGRAEFLVGAEASWSHLASRGAARQAASSIEVELVTLDGLLAAGVPAPDVVKLDIEGSEEDALRGAARMLAEVRPAFVIELHETRDAVCDALEAAGYRLEHLDGPEPIRAARGDAHLLARPA